MFKYEYPFPAVIYFDPAMTEVLCYATWKIAKNSSILLRQIEICIDDELKKKKKGIFFKIEPAFKTKMQSP